MNANAIYRLVLGIAATITPSALLAQDANMPTQQQSMPSASASSGQSNQQDSNATPGLTGQEMKDKIFLRKAAEGGIAEVKLGQLAADKGGSEEVKTFGAKMVADHTMLNNEMKPVADSVGVRLPKEMNKMDKAEYDKLSALSGEDFDKEYIADMVKDHRKDLHEFHMQAATTQDSALKEAVEKGEGVIREHTRMIVKIAKEKGIAIPASGRPAPPPPPAQ